MLLQIKAKQSVILDGKYKGFNPQKPYKIFITLRKKNKSFSLANKAKFSDYKKKSCKLRKARLNLLTVNAPKYLSGKIEVLGIKLPENKFKIRELWIGLLIDSKPYYFKKAIDRIGRGRS